MKATHKASPSATKQSTEEKREEDLVRSRPLVLPGALGSPAFPLTALTIPAMTTMSDDGERTCPLCAEEMDLTDQQLKPCKCGYEICVWCWHHIIDMAEKEDSEGRCPACRTPYDKERIVGMAATCERVVAEVNAEKRQKPQKSKAKTSAEARKHLSGVRVIQRNLVYIIGLPSNLSDENLLERKEYFGQYGKVLKVSIARPTSAAQQTPNSNTFSVYITYAREDEAIRCIQAVHNFALEGKPLRACFGTTKYCHTWLRNMTCSNPDCLYLHDIGSQEDSFTKDEIISAYTRSRVPQIASNNLQRRSGSVLPPPADDYYMDGTVSSKQMVKGASANSSQVKASLPGNISVTKPTVLPAASSWGTRVSNCRQPAASAACSQSPAKQKADLNNASALISSVVANTRQNSAWHDDTISASKTSEGRNGASSVGRSRPSDHLNPSIDGDFMKGPSDVSSEAVDVNSISIASAWDDDETTIDKAPEEKHVKFHVGRSGLLEHLDSSVVRECQQLGSDLSSDPLSLASKDVDRGVAAPRSRIFLHSASEGPIAQSSSSTSGSIAAIGGAANSGNGQDTSLMLPSINADDQSDRILHQNSVVATPSVGIPVSTNLRLQQGQEELVVKNDSIMLLDEHASLVVDVSSTRESACSSPEYKQVAPCTIKQSEGVALSSNDQNHGCSDISSQSSWTYLHQTPNNFPNISSIDSWNNGPGSSNPTGNGLTKSVSIEADGGFLERENEFVLPNGCLHNLSMRSNHRMASDISCLKDKINCLEISHPSSAIDETLNVDTGESSIISGILALDFDPWGDCSAASDGLVSMLREADKQEGPFKLSNSWKVQNNSESRFSFARHENESSSSEQSFADHSQKLFPSSCYSYGESFQDGLLLNGLAAPSSFANSNLAISSDKVAGVSRAKISAPPGFSVRSKAPPPGFSSHDRFDLAHDMQYSENYLNSISLSNQYQPHFTENSTDVEFYDPAILAVGKGRVPLGVNNSGVGLPHAYPGQTSTSETDPRLQLLLQQPIAAQQDLRIPDHFADRFFLSNDSYMPSRILAHNTSSISPLAPMSFQQPRNPHVQNQWNGWTDAQAGNSVSIADILRTESFGLHNYFPGNDEHKFHVPSAADLYNRSFGM